MKLPEKLKGPMVDAIVSFDMITESVYFAIKSGIESSD